MKAYIKLFLLALAACSINTYAIDKNHLRYEERFINPFYFSGGINNSSAVRNNIIGGHLIAGAQVNKNVSFETGVLFIRDIINSEEVAGKIIMTPFTIRLDDDYFYYRKLGFYVKGGIGVFNYISTDAKYNQHLPGIVFGFGTKYSFNNQFDVNFGFDTFVRETYGVAFITMGMTYRFG